ncbi:hypothetical protein ASD67_20925 [Sphingopyxis sp. Root1497]|uniref:TonB-dependent receptor plug domain-containing protein n=1 Tax=Sphingopyxis sp. Root1497 TaxID=1736474 RepID=UPI000700BC0C|nr:TonB-dependent receptor [Sphingopyxis sp. Root1497]KQZ61660.1 hypothetical protein ASD67_20925 [Sphingopyxis sp. Root1497]
MVSFRKSFAVALLTMVSSTAMAQDLTSGTEAEGEALADGESIVVTGTRIKQDGFSATVPINILGAEELEASGKTDLGQILAEMPGVNLVDTTVGQPNGTIQNAGTSTVALRGLSSSRTLTLINGRRTVANAANRSVVSLNTIPVDFVERVDVITGAASAVYGSDAIAGVVNVITESKLEGLRLRGRIGSALTGGGGAEEAMVAATFGAKFADGRGYFAISGSWDDDGGLLARDRLARATKNWTFASGTNTISDPALSTDTPGGRFRGGAFFYDDAGTLRTGFVTNRDGYNDRFDDTLRLPRTVMALAGKASFEVSEAFVPYVEVQFSDLDTFYTRAPYGYRDSSTVFLRDEIGVPLPGLPTFAIGRISRDNPFVPTEIRAGAPASGIDWRRRFDELGNRDTISDRDTLRVWGGVRGKLGGDWTYDATYSYGTFDQVQTRLNNINLQNLKYALDAERLASGVIQCRDATARAAGCVPINIFGVGTITPEAANYIRHDSTFYTKLRQDVFQAFATGSIFELPAGKVQLALGGEYRREKGTSGSDAQTLAVISNVAAVPSFSGSFNVKEAFAELSVPLLSGKPFFEELKVDFAGRVSDYSQKNVGTVYSYHAGADWMPVEGLRFRTQYGTAQRAPSLPELYSPPRDDTDTVVDICSGITATTAGTVAGNCRLNPGIAATIASNGVFTQSSTSIQSPNMGSLALREEKGTTFTLGTVISPRSLPGLNLSVDYYNIKVTNAISALDNEILLRQCYSDATNFAGNEFCQSVIRGADGQILQINQVPQNLDRISTSGIDTSFAYRLPLEGVGVAGDLRFDFNWTHVIKKETQYQGINGTEISNTRGQISSPTDVVRARIGYTNKLWNIDWRVRYIGPMVSSNDRVAAAEAAGFANPLYLYYGAYWRHDIGASIRPEFGGGKWRLSVGITNLFDKTGPNVPEGATPFDDNGYILDYGVVGRSGFASIEVKF